MERDLLVGELVVDRGVGVDAPLNIGLVASVEVDLQEPRSLDLASCALSGDLGGVDNVLKNGILDSRQGARARTKSLRLLRSGVGLAEDLALGNDDDMSAAELLLELTDKLGLDALEGLLELVRNVQDDGLAASSAVDLLGGGDVEVTEGRLELSRGHLQVQELLSNLVLELIGFLDASVESDCRGKMTDKRKDQLIVEGKDHF